MELETLESRNDRRMGVATLGIGIAALLFGLFVSAHFVIGLGAVAILVGLWSVLDRRVKLRIDGLGIWYAPWGRMPVQWGEIAAIETRTLRGIEQVCLVPLYPDQILERMPTWYRWASWLTEKVWGGRFILSTNGLQHGTPFLLDVLRRYHRLRT